MENNTATTATALTLARARLFDAYNRRSGADALAVARARLDYDAARKAWRRAGGVGTALAAVCDEDDARLTARQAARRW